MQQAQPQRYVAYYRVSTQRQGMSGLGLEAQQAAVANYLRPYGVKPIAEFMEIESGRKTNRPELSAALQMAEKEQAILVIAKLDRLARSVSFISKLLDGKVPFVSTDMPEANRMMLQMSAVFAEHEAKMISDRTKAALAAAKERGVKLGGTQASTRARIDAFDKRMFPIVQSIIDSGAVGPAAIARELNAKQIPTAAGKQWVSTQVTRLIKRIERM